MSFRNQVVGGGFVLALLTVWAGATLTWERDLHYGLVKWLAVQAGFTLEHAELIAAGSESADETAVLSAVGVHAISICAARSAEASRHVQQFHFPSGGYPPVLSSGRVVNPGTPTLTNAANRWARQEVEVAWGSGPNSVETQLYRLGASLHPLADSWSHQGEPGIHPLCKVPQLAWGHPDTRDGPRQHYADVTYRYSTDAKATAGAIYHYLLAFRAAHPSLPYSGPPQDIKKLQPDLETFAKASTKWAKYDWFQAQGDSLPYDGFTTYNCFLRGLSIANDGGRFAPRVPCAAPPSQAMTVAKPLPPLESETAGVDGFIGARFWNWMVGRNYVDDFIREQLRSWIVRRNYDAVIESFSEREIWQSELLGEGMMAVAQDYGDEWFRLMLDMWLVEDHGMVSELGHGISSGDGLAVLNRLLPEVQRISAVETISEAIRSASGTASYDLSPLPDEEGYLVTFQFRHIERDLLMLQVSQIDGQWRIVRFGWMTS